MYRFSFSITFDNSDSNSGYSFNYTVRLFQGSDITIVETGVILNLTIEECLLKEQDIIKKYS